MSEQMLSNLVTVTQQKLCEKETPRGRLEVYQTPAFGLTLTHNGQIVMSASDSYIFHEMMAHSILFTHAKPQKIAIIGTKFGILPEVMKHANVQEICCINDNPYIEEALNEYFPQYQQTQDNRVKHLSLDSLQWLSQCEMDSFDIIIQTTPSEEFLTDNFKSYFRALRADGMFVQPCPVTMMELDRIKHIYHNIHHAGFTDRQLLNFPQPSAETGSRTLIMATKRETFHRIRERDIYNRAFTTRYYNFDVHKAALALPEFAREALELVE